MHDGIPYGRIQGQGQGHEPIQGSRIENLQSREVDRQSPTGLILVIANCAIICIRPNSWYSSTAIRIWPNTLNSYLVQPYCLMLCCTVQEITLYRRADRHHQSLLASQSTADNSSTSASPVCASEDDIPSRSSPSKSVSE